MTRPLPGHPDVLVGPAGADDAGVFRIDGRRALVQTLDFFTPVVDDPGDWGAIAATNALSDVYAMGGVPLTALNIVAWPRDGLPMDLLGRVLDGAAEVLEAGKRGCSPEKILDERILDIPAGSDGLLLQPYWTSGILKPDSMGAVVGFTDFHSRYHLYRAIIEGIDMELYQALRIMEKRSGLEIKELFVSGGGSRSDTVCRITADVFGLPVKRIQTPEACSIGSSMAALVALGVYDSFEQAAKEMVHETRAFLPDANNHRIYMEIYEKAYSRIYGKLQPIYRSLNDIYKRR